MGRGVGVVRHGWRGVLADGRRSEGLKSLADGPAGREPSDPAEDHGPPARTGQCRFKSAILANVSEQRFPVVGDDFPWRTIIKATVKPIAKMSVEFGGLMVSGCEPNVAAL